MKKLLTSTLAFALVASMGVTAFAANTATNDGTADTYIPVNGTYQAGTPAAEVISVDIAWDAMNFTYTAPSKGTWNPKTHQYENPTAGGWSTENGTDPKIAVTNHSNIPVKASFTFAANISGLDGLFSKKALLLDTAENTAPGNAPKDETTFSLAGEGIDATQNVGTINVTVANAVTTVSTAAELRATANKTGIFTLADNIDLGTSAFEINSDNYVLDLNRHTLSGCVDNSTIILITGGNVTIKNGTVHNTSDILGKGIGTCSDKFIDKFILENCKSVSFYAALDIGLNTVACITDCEIQTRSSDYFSFVNQGDLMLSGNVNVNVKGVAGYKSGTVTALAGTYNFDPTSYVDTTLYDITQNTEAGTWTVTAK